MQVTDGQWIATQNALLALEQFKIAFLTVEKDDATLWTVVKQFEKLEEHIKNLHDTPGLKTFAQGATKVLGARWSSQFQSDAVHALKYLDPSNTDEYTPANMMKTLSFLKKVGALLWAFRHPEQELTSTFNTEITNEVAAYHAKSDPFDLLDYNLPFWDFWKFALLCKKLCLCWFLI